MEADLLQKIATLERKIDAIGVSVEKTRKYFLWMLVGYLVFLLLPIIGLMFALPVLFQALSIFETL